MTHLAYQHADVVCPPHQDAMCTCGAPLGEHRTPSALDVPDVDAECDDSGRFELMAGESFDCDHVQTCEPCGAEICGEHSNAFTSCADRPGTLHHLDCVDLCRPCGHARIGRAV